jgi:hypothetical protein
VDLYSYQFLDTNIILVVDKLNSLYRYVDTIIEKKDEAITTGKSTANVFMKNKGSLLCILLIIVAIIMFYITYNKAKQ